jgi:hypothetical protein
MARDQSLGEQRCYAPSHDFKQEPCARALFLHSFIFGGKIVRRTRVLLVTSFRLLDDGDCCDSRPDCSSGEGRHNITDLASWSIDYARGIYVFTFSIASDSPLL